MDIEVCSTTSESNKTTNQADNRDDIFGYKCSHMSNEKLRILEKDDDDFTLKEVEPCRARTADLCSMVSFWDYTPEEGVQCKHSFFIPNRCTKLFTGHNGDVFYFEKELN